MPRFLPPWFDTPEVVDSSLEQIDRRRYHHDQDGSFQSWDVASERSQSNDDEKTSKMAVAYSRSVTRTDRERWARHGDPEDVAEIAAGAKLAGSRCRSEVSLRSQKSHL